MSKSSSLLIHQLRVQVADREVVRGVDLRVQPGELQVIIGPNGSGKSSLAQALAGHPQYQVVQGKVILDGQNLLNLSPDERAQLGFLVAFQQPVVVPGVKVQNFLRQAYEARFAGQAKKQFATVLAFRQYLEQLAKKLHVPVALLKRGLNEDFSGGEKKRLELLQLTVLEPRYAVLDEPDSGLDIDAVKTLANNIQFLITELGTGVILITHYQRLLRFLKPAAVHLFIDGRIVATGDQNLAAKLEKEGYRSWQK